MSEKIISQEDISKIIEHYHGRDHNNDYDKGNLGFGFIHYSLIRNLRPERVLVVGSQKGYIPAICALACKHEKKGVVHFVDAGYELEDEDSWGGIGIWKKVDSSYWEPLGVEEFITLHNMPTEEFERKMGDHKFGYIYIDGDHSYEGVKRDFELFWEHLEVGGFMSFHDVLVDKETKYGKCGVKKFWEELIGGQKKNIITLPFSAGLGIIGKCND